ncbi:MAG: DUF5711 family protein [Leptospiraceae bacterium]|nr:DUF5711 family protein [Leptospiraceae bacterium]
MIYYIVFTTIFSYLFLFLYPEKYQLTPRIESNWAWDKSSEVGLEEDSRYKISHKKIWNGYKLGGEYLFSKYKINREEGILEIPAFGKGYFVYKKIGSGISYYSKSSELLWNKPYQSYPFSSPNGKLCFLVSGDGNQVLVIDENGISVGVEKLDGRFLTDYSFSREGNSVIVFSGGEIFILDKTGKLLFKKKNDSEKEILFYKSSSISPNGTLVAIHHQKAEKDYILIFDLKSNEESEIELSKIYPHKIYLSISDSKTLAVNLKDELLIFDKKGKLIHKTEKKKNLSIYQPILSSDGIFAAQIDDNIVFLNEKGDVLKFISNFKEPLRLLLSPIPNLFYVETPEEIISYQIFP